jgi:dGTPase
MEYQNGQPVLRHASARASRFQRQRISRPQVTLPFEGNGQTLRILGRLENFSAGAGANLSRRTMLGVLKYPVAFDRIANPALVPALLSGPTTIKIIDGRASKPPKCYLDSEQDVVDWILAPLPAADREVFQTFAPQDGKHGKPLHKALDCSIMNAADDIAYGVHDLEDAIALGLVSKDAFAAALQDKCPSFLDALKAKYPGESENDVFAQMIDGLFGGDASRKRFIGRLVHHFLTAVECVERPEFSEPFLRWCVRVASPQRVFLDVLQDFVVREVITSPAVQHLEFKGQGMVVTVFEAMQADPRRLLPRDELVKFEAAGSDLRVICDYVAAITDTHLLKTYERLFSPRMGSVFDHL